VSADFIIGGSFKPKPDDEEEEEEEKEEDENRDAIVFVVCAPLRAGEEDDEDDDERPLRDFPKPSFLRIFNARFQNSPPPFRLPPLFPPEELNASAPNFPSSTNRMLCVYFKSCLLCVL
jgi:hypothetical protein